PWAPRADRGSPATSPSWCREYPRQRGYSRRTGSVGRGRRRRRMQRVAHELLDVCEVRLVLVDPALRGELDRGDRLLLRLERELDEVRQERLRQIGLHDGGARGGDVLEARQHRLRRELL